MAKGKKKKSKGQEEAERLQREEEERKYAEAELRRQEEQRIEREEQQKKRREELAKARREELERITKEVENEDANQDAEEKRIAQDEKEDREKTTWSKYLACNPRPDPSMEFELNTFLDTWASEDEPLLGDTMKSVQYCEQVAADLIAVMANAEAKADDDRVELCRGFLKKLWELTVQKLDRGSAFILQHSDELTTADVKNELMLEQQLDGIKYGIWVNLVVKGFRMKPVRFNDVGIGVDVPKPVAVQTLAMRCMYFPQDHQQYERNCQDRALGGVFEVQLLSLPQQPKRVKGWTLRQVNDLTESVDRLMYPLGSGEHGHATGPGAPVKVMYHLPDDVLIPEETLRVGWWNPANMVWDEEGIEGIDYHPETRKLQFHTCKLSQMCCIQEKHADLPYVGWSLVPVNVQWPAIEAHLTLQTPRFEVVIAIRENECQLIKPEAPQLEGIRSEPMAPGLLLKRLAHAGINIMPTDRDAKFAKHPTGEAIVVKVPQLEAKIGYEVAQVATAMDVRNSRWNPVVGEKRTVVLVRETTAFSGDYAKSSAADDDGSSEDYKTILCEVDNELPKWNHRYVKEDTAVGLKSSILSNVTEMSESFDPDDVQFNHENRPRTRIYLNNCLQGNAEDGSPNCSPECLERKQETTPRFQQTVQEMLHLTRPFSFS
jgi:cancer susceptibility candidate protein 1